MGLGDLVNKAKEWAGRNPDNADKVVDQGASALKERLAGHDEQIDSATAKAKEYLHGSGDSHDQDAPRAGEPEPPAQP